MNKQTFPGKNAPQPGRRTFVKTAAAVFTTSLCTGNVRGANDRITGAFIGVGMMGSENLSIALEHGVHDPKTT